MKRMCLILSLLLAWPAGAQQPPIVATDPFPAEAPALADLQGVARPLVIFADTPDDAKFERQMQMLRDRPDELAARSVVVLTDTDPAANGPLRRQLRPTRGFGGVLIDIDGSIAARRPAPVTVRELIHMIDRTPSRRLETGSHRP